MSAMGRNRHYAVRASFRKMMSQIIQPSPIEMIARSASGGQEHSRTDKGRTDDYGADAGSVCPERQPRKRCAHEGG